MYLTRISEYDMLLPETTKGEQNPMKQPLLKITFLCFTVMFLICLPISANSPEPEISAPSGTYGDNLTWTLSEDGVLTISGVGPMADLPYEERWTDLIKKDVVQVRIESGITHIGNDAFSNFSRLQSVSMADTVTSIGAGAFYFCEALDEITLSENLMSIGNAAFSFCCDLTSIMLPDGITVIESSTFQNCLQLQNVTFPKHLKSIENQAFAGCRMLHSWIRFPEGLETIGDKAFYQCSILPGFSEPSSLRLIGNSAFAECSNLWAVSLQCVSVVIGDWAFAKCENLEKVDLEYGVTDIGMGAFSSCPRLQTVVLPGSLTELKNGVFQMCTSLEKIVIPMGVTHISRAFAYCTALKQITIPPSVTEIEWNAFHCCSALQSVTIPHSVNHLHEQIFDSCTSLETVTVYAAATQFEMSIWGGFHGYAPKDVVYRCYENSDMHAYAIEHNLNYELLTDWDTVFSDIRADDPAYSAICHMADRGIFVGTSDDTFSPDMPLTRAMFVTLLGRMAGIDAAAYTEQVFVDVPMDAWYAPYAAWAADEGIVIGVGDHHFGGDMLIDIQQAVTMLARYCGFPWDIVHSGQSAYDFPDSTEEMTYWSDSGIFWAVRIGLYEGKNGLLDLYTPLTRADTAVLFSRFCQLILGA